MGLFEEGMRAMPASLILMFVGSVTAWGVVMTGEGKTGG